MVDKTRSRPPDKAANNRKLKLPGTGCSIALALLLVGLVLAVVVLGPRLLDRLANQTATVPLALEDRTSPEQLAAHRQREVAQLNRYGWLDREADIAQIPIERAMALVAETGLPVGHAPANDEPPISGAQPDAAIELADVDLANVNYQDHVLPIFEQHCAECHGAEDPEEGLELTRYRTAMVGSQYGPVIQPGDPDNSYLVELVVSGQMPNRRDPLSPHEIAIIIAWIEAGAPEQGTPTPESTPDASQSPATSVDPANVSFQDHVLPIFEQHCAECHGAEDPEEGLELTRYRTAIVGSQNGPVIEPGDPDRSYLVDQIVSGKMPKRRDPLSPTEIETIIAWIKAGAEDN